MHQPKVILVVLDGWGYSPIHKGNAIWAAKTPTFDYLWSHYPHGLLNAFGENVGLPWGAIGSSEVGHTSIGTGKLVRQELSLLDKEILDGSFFKREGILRIIRETKKAKKPLHLVGLISDGGVHSHLRHLYALLKMLRMNGFDSNIYIHAITDGRDTSPKSSVQYIKELLSHIKSLGIDAKIASISGRYYAMDRDKRWDRTKEAYLAMTKPTNTTDSNLIQTLQNSFAQGITDEFIKPVAFNIASGNLNLFDKFLKKATERKTYSIAKGDGVIFFNIRPDRMRQLTHTFLSPQKEMKTLPVPGVHVLTMTTYDEFLPVEVAYPAEKAENPLAKILSDNGIKQGHFAETEKYAHVTYFFNGGNPEPFKNEIWKLVPSPSVTTYDQKPEMSAVEITNTVFSTVKKEELDFVLINYANPDMVGHTGKFDKVVKAVETVDQQLERLLKTFSNSTIIVTADHGNAECMIHPETGEIDKKHTVNPVPFILAADKYKKAGSKQKEIRQALGILADIAPTVLHLFDLGKDKNMNGVTLLDSLV